MPAALPRLAAGRWAANPMNRRHRLTSPEDFKRVRRSGKSFAHPLLVLVVSPSEHGDVRVGITAGKALGGAAARNRAKRRLREAVRPILPAIHGGWELVLVARPGAEDAEWDTLRRGVQGLLSRAGLIEINLDERSPA